MWNLTFQLLKALDLHTTMLVATKLGRVVTYHQGFPPIKSRNLLITWSGRIKSQNKAVYLHYITPMATKLGRVVTYLEGLLRIKSHMALESCRFARPCEKLKIFLHHHIAFGHQTWQCSDLPRGTLTHNLWTFKDVVTWDYLTNWNY